MLNAMYSLFDTLTERNRVYKVFFRFSGKDCHFSGNIVQFYNANLILILLHYLLIWQQILCSLILITIKFNKKLKFVDC